MLRESNMFAKHLYRNRNNLIRLIGFSAAAAMTLKFIYFDSYAKTRSANEEYDPSTDKLVSVLMMSRHGARTRKNSKFTLFISACLNMKFKFLFNSAPYSFWT